MWRAFIILMIFDMPWIILLTMRTAAAGGGSNQDLQGKGISAATMEEAWQVWRENGGEQDEQRMIREQLHKKHYDPEEETDWKERQKIYAFLARKGFSAEAIRKAIGGMHSDDF